jgi:hypothetical protein
VGSTCLLRRAPAGILLLEELIGQTMHADCHCSLPTTPQAVAATAQEVAALRAASQSEVLLAPDTAPALALDELAALRSGLERAAAEVRLPFTNAFRVRRVRGPCRVYAWQVHGTCSTGADQHNLHLSGALNLPRVRNLPGGPHQRLPAGVPPGRGRRGRPRSRGGGGGPQDQPLEQQGGCAGAIPVQLGPTKQAAGSSAFVPCVPQGLGPRF